MAKEVTASNLLDYIMAYEGGNMSQEEYLQMFAYLIKTGKAWTLQGSLYVRPARDLIKFGVISEKGKINRKKLKELM